MWRLRGKGCSGCKKTSGGTSVVCGRRESHHFLLRLRSAPTLGDCKRSVQTALAALGLALSVVVGRLLRFGRPDRVEGIGGTGADVRARVVERFDERGHGGLRGEPHVAECPDGACANAV